jgi:hypothetical protein
VYVGDGAAYFTTKANKNFGLSPDLQVCSNSAEQFTKVARLSVDTTGYTPARSSG